jgi:hypothetical protein
LASYTINAVRKDPAVVPVAHRHIAAVRLTSGQSLMRAQVIAYIRAGDTFTTVGDPPGRVHVHACPYCHSGDYITTHPDDTITNNLDDLPLF